MRQNTRKNIFKILALTLVAVLLSGTTVMAAPVAPLLPLAPGPVTPVAPVAQVYTVEFDLNGGTQTGGGDLTQYIPRGNAAVAPTVYREGYTFKEWDVPFNAVYGDLHVTAQWTVTPAVPVMPIAPGPVTPAPPIAPAPGPAYPTPPVAQVYTITFDLNGGTRVGGGALTQAVPQGLSAVEPYVFRQNYTFSGWSRPFTNVTSSYTVVAQWYAKPVAPVAPAPPVTTVPGSFVNGKNTFTQFSHLPLIYYINLNVANLANVQIDGHILTTGVQYAATTGTTLQTTAIHLNASYLNNLAAGSHTLNVNFTDGSYSTAQFTVATYRNAFTDVHSGDWFYKGVEAMNASELLMGVTNTQFSPYSQMTRGMVVTLLYRFAGEPSVAGFRNPFPDVAPNQYYTNSAIWAAANGIVVGHEDGTFAPSEMMTHEQFAAVLYRYQNALGNVPRDVQAANNFSDFNQISLYARSAVTKLTTQGVFTDFPYDAANRFQPQAAVTRAEVATVMRLWIESIGW